MPSRRRVVSLSSLIVNFRPWCCDPKQPSQRQKSSSRSALIRGRTRGEEFPLCWACCFQSSLSPPSGRPVGRAGRMGQAGLPVKPAAPRRSQLSPKTTGHSLRWLRVQPGPGRSGTQIKRGRARRPRLVLCESPLRLTQECGNDGK